MADFLEILNEKFQAQELDQCIQVALRAALRGFPDVNTKGNVDLSREYIFPIGRLLLASSLAYIFPVATIEQRLVAALGMKELTGLLQKDSSAVLAAQALLNRSRKHAILASEDVITVFASEAMGAKLIFSGIGTSDGLDSEYFDVQDKLAMLSVRDFERPHRKAFDSPLWFDLGSPLAPYPPRVNIREYTNNRYFSFWREWYQGFLDGKPMDWELQRRVAMIPDEDWEKGPEHIARVIEDIRKDFDGVATPEQERFEALEPASLERILRAPTLSAGQIEAAAQGIRDAEYRYLNETGANQLPDPFQALPKIAGSMVRVSHQIRQHASDPTVEDSLCQEIGRLNARVIELEQELEILRKAPARVFLPALKEQIGKSLGDWKMYGAMCGALWLISGDDLGMQQRLENLDAARAAIFGTEATTSDVLPDETPQVIEI